MHNKYIFIIPTFLLFFAISFFTSQTAQAKVITVGNNDENYQSIQEAINNANDNDTILISSGTYKENLTINKNNLELIGEDKDDVILESPNPQNNYGIEIIDTDGNTNLKILNMTIQKFLYGIYGSTESNNLSNILISNIHFISNGDTNLPTNCSQNNPYKNCSNWHDQGGAIKLKNITNSSIENNIIEKGERGILIFNIDNQNPNNTIIHNQIFDNQQYGIRLNNAASHTKISYNIIYDNESEGIEIYRTDDKFDTNLQISHNRIYQNSNDGIRIENVKDSEIKNNSITKNASSTSVPYPPGTDPVFGGIYLDNAIDTIITENDIDENSYQGLNLGQNSANLTIFNNSIKNHTHTPQCTDNGSFNNFNKDNIGNFWSDKSNDIDYYDIEGTANNKDNAPLLSPPTNISKETIWLKVDEYKPKIIKLAWNNVTLNNFSEYVIEITNNESHQTMIFDKDRYIDLKQESTNSILLSHLIPNTTYTARIKARNVDNSEIVTSEDIVFKTTFDVEIPSQPTKVQATYINTEKAFIYWFLNPSSENISYYEVYRKIDNDEYQYFKKVISPNTYMYDDSININQTYYYKVRAKNNFGFSLFSQPITISSNTSLSFDETRHINKLSKNDITSNTVVSKVEDLKSELLFTPELTKEISDNPMIVFGLEAETDESDFRIVNLKYSSISNKTYYYSISDIKSTINLENLPSEALVSIKYTNNDIKNLNEDFLTIALYDQVKQRWLPLLSQINPNSNIITARTHYLGVFKILYNTKPISFYDISPSDWVYGYVQNLNRSSIINGYNDNSFRPEAFASRAEVVKMSLLANGFKIPLFTFENPCKDIEKDKWYATYFQFAINKGLIRGYEDSTCKPNQHITRAEALKIILGSKGENYDASYVPFDDFNQIPEWSIPYIRYALDHNIISGYSDNTFRADNPITRQELAKILYESYKLE